MRRIALTVLTAAAVLAPAGSASADYVLDGRGFGHGVGMSQYGAYGYALREGRDFRWILGHYYPGTTVGRLADQRGRRTNVGGEVAGHGLGLGGGDREDHWTTTSMRWNSLSSV